MRRIASIEVTTAVTIALIFVVVFYGVTHFYSLNTMPNPPRKAFEMMQPVIPREYSHLTAKQLYLKTMVVLLTGYVFKDDPLKMGPGARKVLHGKFKDEVDLHGENV